MQCHVHVYDFCWASGVHPGNAQPRAVQGSSEGFKGGADGKTTGVSESKASDCTTLLRDVTFPLAYAQFNKERHRKSTKRGATATRLEFEKRRYNEYEAVAERNNWQFFPACILKDACFMGNGTKDLINRIAGHRHGETFESEGCNDKLFDAGAFFAPKAKAYWTRALLVTMINAGEKAVAERLAKAEALDNQ